MRYNADKGPVEWGTVEPNSVVELRAVQRAGCARDSLFRYPGLRLVPPVDTMVFSEWPHDWRTLPNERLTNNEVAFEDDGGGLYCPYGGQLFVVGGSGEFDCFVIKRPAEPWRDYVWGWARSLEFEIADNARLMNVPLGWGYRTIEASGPMGIELIRDAGNLMIYSAAGQIVTLPPALQFINLNKQDPDNACLVTIRGRL